MSKLEMRIIKLEIAARVPVNPEWVCTLKAFGSTYTGLGKTMAVAKVSSIKNCSEARSGDSFFCKNPKCEK